MRITESENVYTRMSACGLDCTVCDIYLLPVSEEVQAKILPWFRSRGWLGENEGIDEVIERKMYCKGCGDKEVWWSDNCEVAKCCIQEKKLQNCSVCPDCACEIYRKWGEQGGKYAEAFKYMTEMKGKQ